MAAEANPTLQRLLLRRALRTAREQAQHTQIQVAAAMDWSESKLLRIESGQSSISINDLLALLELYKVTDAELVSRLRGYAREGRREPWTEYRDVLKPEFLTYVALEGIAHRIWHFNPMLVPGLLQTADYAERTISLFAASGTSADVLHRQREARLRRQRIFATAEPPVVHCILDEAVIRRIADSGDPVHRGQLQHLLDAARQPISTIQVLPFDRGLHAGLGGPFTILGLPGGCADGDCVYVERSRGESALRESSADVARYRDIFAGLADAAAGPDTTAELIDRLLRD